MDVFEFFYRRRNNQPMYYFMIGALVTGIVMMGLGFWYMVRL
ncbi:MULTISPECIES: hypothetical protein [Aneurinibacillus]|jgi:hypothetical protein|uniref:Uncharacterized protein n=1 Tax=Aneurinibacillus danicus TaxID=267746 RepID=A0A511V6Z4_9BACL|nr:MULTISPECIES: hypothetical protein [Aneurinibacillus]GEN33911.1 hypothetical protein ADA01nite_13710 [Aneurinibacillus danicus]